jgi:hypothetical protein
MSPGTSCAAHTSRPIATAGKTRTTQLSATPQVNTRNGFRRRSAMRVASNCRPRRIVFVWRHSIRRHVPSWVWCPRNASKRRVGYGVPERRCSGPRTAAAAGLRVNRFSAVRVHLALSVVLFTRNAGRV